MNGKKTMFVCVVVICQRHLVFFLCLKTSENERKCDNISLRKKHNNDYYRRCCCFLAVIIIHTQTNIPNR